MISHRSLGFTLLVLALAATTASATINGAVAYPTQGKITGDRVAIRAKAEITSNVVIYAYADQAVSVLGETGEWYVVELPREYPLWVSKEFIKAGAAGAGEITADRVNLRAGPGVQYTSEGQTDSGRRVEVLQEKDGWIRFRFIPGDRGYVSRRYVTLAGETAPRPMPEPPKPVIPEPPKPVVVPTPPTPPTPPEPPKPEPIVETPPETDQTILDAFNKAEEIYKREVKKDNIAEWNLDEAYKLYVAVMDKTHNPSLLSRCRSRLAVVRTAQRYRDLANTTDPRAQLDKRTEEIDREFARKRAALADEIRHLYPTCIAAGRVERLASAWLQPATHKLIREDRVVFLLRGDAVDLSKYEDKFVGIEGDVDDSVKWPIPTVKVRGVVLPPAKE